MELEDIIGMFARDIESQDYTVEWVGNLEVPAIIVHERHLVLACKECCTPFYLQHELIHILFRHVGRLHSFNGNDERNPNEAEVNQQANTRILTFHREHDWELNVNITMDWYGIPSYLESEVS